MNNLFLCLLCASQLATPWLPSCVGASAASTWRKGEVIVKFREGVDPKLLKAAGFPELNASALPEVLLQVHHTNALSGLRPLAHPGWTARLPEHSSLRRAYVLRFVDPGVDVPMLCRTLSAAREIEYAEPNYQVKANFVPNDPYFSSSGSWGQPYDDQWGLKLAQVPAAWDSLTGTNEALVAIVDSGVDLNHPDLAGRIATNGWNFESDTADVTDDYGHGTLCAGIIAATVNNNQGIAGVCRNVKILPLKFLDSNGRGYVGDAASAIDYAVNNGAGIINLSFSGPDTSMTLENAVHSAHGVNTVMIASAGNESSESLQYPASYRNVITVGATDHQDRLADFSNYGPRIDVVAPGGESGGAPFAQSIVSLRASGTAWGTPVDALYSRASGTSLAASFVSGVVALMRNETPRLPVERIRQILRTTADDVGEPGWDWQTGYGRVNASAALRHTNAIITLLYSPVNFQYVSGLVTTVGSATGVPFGYWVQEWGEGFAPTNWTMIGSNSARLFNTPLATWDTSTVPDGEYTLRLRAYDADGNRYEDRVAVTVYNSLYNFDPPRHRGWPQAAGVANVSPPVMADLNQDGRKEILWAGLRSMTIANEDGTTYLSWGLYDNPCGPPTVGDLDGDGRPEVGVISTGIRGYSGEISIRRGSGQPLSGWPKTGNFLGIRDVSPVFADVDADGLADVIWCASTSNYWGRAVVNVDRWDGSPLPGWPVVLPEGAGVTDTSPSVGDLDGDGRMDVVVHCGSEIHLLHYNGQSFSGWPVKIAGAGPWSAAPPALGDVDHDGQLEVVVTSGTAICLYEVNGQPMPGWPQPWEGSGPPALGDLDGGPELEIVIGGGPPRIFRSDGTLLPGWPPKYGGGWFQPPIVADLDADGRLDVASADGQGYVRAWNVAGKELYGLGFPIKATTDACYSGPVVGDVDDDGRFEILVFGTDNEHLSHLDLWNLGTLVDPDRMPHPTMLVDNAHTSRHQVRPRLFSASPNWMVNSAAAVVTLKGDYFLKGMRVSLAGNQQTVLSETVMSITVSVPAGLPPGWRDVTVSNVNSSATTLPRGLAIIDSPVGDHDFDGLPNGWELTHSLDPFDNGSTSAANGPAGDPDHDGASNWAEYRAGTDPQDRLSFFRISGASLVGPSAVSISWVSAPDRTYAIYAASDLSGPYLPVTNHVTSTPPLNTFLDQVGSGPAQRYYKVAVE